MSIVFYIDIFGSTGPRLPLGISLGDRLVRVFDFVGSVLNGRPFATPLGCVSKKRKQNGDQITQAFPGRA